MSLFTASLGEKGVLSQRHDTLRYTSCSAVHTPWWEQHASGAWVLRSRCAVGVQKLQQHEQVRQTIVRTSFVVSTNPCAMPFVAML